MMTRLIRGDTLRPIQEENELIAVDSGTDTSILIEESLRRATACSLNCCANEV
jgi:hypothetical protein